MAECETTLADLLAITLPVVDVDVCGNAKRIIGLAQQHIALIMQDPCAFDEVEIAGVKSGSDRSIKRLESLIKCMQLTCDNQTKSEVFSRHTFKNDHWSC